MDDTLENKTLNNVVLDKQYIKSLVQLILNNSHSLVEKRRIVEHNGELNFSCPICGDSSKIQSKKRGHVYFNSLYYKCYNDESCSRSFTRLLKTFNIEMDLDKKLEMYDYLENNITYHNNQDIQFSNLDKLFNIQELMDFYSDKKYRHITNLRPLQDGSVVDKYVRKHRRIKYTENIYEAMFYITDKWCQPVMVFLNKVKDKVVSLQVRNLLDGDKRMFKIYDFSKIYGEIYPNVELDIQEKISYDKLSHFFNIFNIDFTRTINMFEGYVDSLSLSNSIGLIGLNTDISFLLKEEGIDIRFIYDNDAPGFKKTRSMLEQKHTVFLWNKFYLDFIKDYKGKMNKSELIHMLQHEIKDFNKLSTKFKQPIEKLFNFDKYFSNDDLDIYYLMDLESLVKIGY
jgi:hypothetical protein